VRVARGSSCGRVETPKSGRPRTIDMSLALGDVLQRHDTTQADWPKRHGTKLYATSNEKGDVPCINARSAVNSDPVTRLVVNGKLHDEDAISGPLTTNSSKPPPGKCAGDTTSTQGVPEPGPKKSTTMNAGGSPHPTEVTKAETSILISKDPCAIET
jgi:hypothetical protein